MMSLEKVLKEMRSVRLCGFEEVVNEWADAIEAANKEKDAAHAACVRTIMEWRNKDRREAEQLRRELEELREDAKYSGSIK